MEWLIENGDEILNILSAIAILVILVVGMIGGPALLKKVEKIVNILERTTGRDLDKDGDIGEPGKPNS